MRRGASYCSMRDAAVISTDLSDIDFHAKKFADALPV
jgi:hypothetical protein